MVLGSCMKKSYTALIVLITSIGLGFAAFYNSDEWNSLGTRAFSDTEYIENPDIMEMIEKQLTQVDYAAIVYPTATKTTPNSWFHKVVMNNPYDSTYHAIRADVGVAILGSDYKTITYASATRPESTSPQPSYATLVLLCGNSPDNLYAPETGYEFSASKKLVEYFKQRGKLPTNKNNDSVCSE